MAGARPRGHHGRMTTPGNLVATHGERLRANWPALLLPLVAADTLGLNQVGSVPTLLVIVTVVMAFVAPSRSAKISPYAILGYGGYGLFLFHSLSLWESPPVVYGIVPAGIDDNAGFVLPQAIAF